uniref:MMS19 nucleotide excision repair protein n=1 Tax=Panagrolaimus sp. JU765 TaxID=591449 RepID=A0AC34RHA7_9BILA
MLEFFLKERLSGLKQLGSVFVYSFMRAVNGERDPRCLLQVFGLFLEVVKNFDLGIYCEDFFELVAAYFPLQYIPTENQVSKE